MYRAVVMVAIAIAVTVQKKAQVVKVAANRIAKEIHRQQRAHQKSNANQNIQNHHGITAKTQHPVNMIRMHRLQAVITMFFFLSIYLFISAKPFIFNFN